MGRFTILRNWRRRRRAQPFVQKRYLLGMNMENINYYDQVQFFQNPARQIIYGYRGYRVQLALGGGIGGPYNSASSSNVGNTSPDGELVVSTSGELVGSCKVDQLGNLYAKNTFGAGGTRHNDLQISVYQYMPNVPWIIDFRGAPVTYTSGTHISGVVQVAPGRFKFNVIDQAPDGKVAAVMHFDTSACSDNDKVNAVMWRQSLSTGATYENADPDRDKLMLVPERQNWVNAGLKLTRFLDNYYVNHDSYGVKTLTEMPMRPASAVALVATTYYLGIREQVQACNEMGSGIWAQIGHRTHRSAYAMIAAEFAKVDQHNNVAEHSNEVWNDTFGQNLEIPLLGVRAGFATVTRARDAVPIPNVKWVPGEDHEVTPKTALATNDLYFVSINGAGFLLMKSKTDKPDYTGFATADVPIRDRFPQTVSNPASGTHAAGRQIFVGASGAIAYEAIQDVPTGILITNTAYWQASTTWEIVLNATKCAQAGNNWRANENIAWWRAMDVACDAISKPHFFHALNTQFTGLGSWTQALTMMEWEGDTVNPATGLPYFFWELYDGRAQAPYQGQSVSVNINNFARNMRTSGPLNTVDYNAGHRLGLYDRVGVTADQAVDRLKEEFLKPDSRAVMEDGAVAALETAYDAEVLWWAATHPGKGHKVRQTFYEWGINLAFDKSDWPDTAGAYSATVDYAPNPSSKAGYTRAVDPSTGKSTTYCCMTANGPSSTVVDPRTDTTGVWEKVTNATYLPDPTQTVCRLMAFLMAIQRDPRFGLIMTEFAAKLLTSRVVKDSDFLWACRYTAQNNPPAADTVNYQTWGHRWSQNDVTHPAWVSATDVATIWNAKA